MLWPLLESGRGNWLTQFISVPRRIHAPFELIRPGPPGRRIRVYRVRFDALDGYRPTRFARRVKPSVVVLPSEEVLAQQFGVSRPAVRKGITELRAGGLVEVMMGRRMFIRSPHSRPGCTRPRGVRRDSNGRYVEADGLCWTHAEEATVTRTDAPWHSPICWTSRRRTGVYIRRAETGRQASTPSTSRAGTIISSAEGTDGKPVRIVRERNHMEAASTAGTPAWQHTLEACGLLVLGRGAPCPVPAVLTAIRAVTGVEVKPAVTVPESRPEAAAELDRQWLAETVTFPLVSGTGEFLIVPPGRGGSSVGWVLVRDSVETGLPSRVADATGSPEFVALSADGRHLCAVTSEEDEHWIVTRDLA